MGYGILADLVLVAHLAFILFMALGGILWLRWSWFPWVHLPTALWGVLLEVRGWICPLTPLENWLRREGGAAGYEGGFVENYLLPIVYPAELTREVQIVLAVVLAATNVLTYATVAWLRRRRSST